MAKTKIEDPITEELKESLERVYFKVLNLLAGSIKSEREIERKIEQYLKKEKLETEDHWDVKYAVIKRLKELGHYDDNKFTKEFLDNILLSSRPRSRKEIVKKLFSKGVSRNIIDKFISKIDSSHEQSSAKKYIEKKLRRQKKPLNFEEKNKLIRQALSRGYDYQVVKTIVDSIDSVK